jgi:hypothetical protein
MPKYIATRDTLLAHENRVVKAGEQFETTFPKAKVDGKEVDMRLGDNIELVKEGKTKAGKPEGDGGDLA